MLRGRWDEEPKIKQTKEGTTTKWGGKSEYGMVYTFSGNYLNIG